MYGPSYTVAFTQDEIYDEFLSAEIDQQIRDFTSEYGAFDPSQKIPRVTVEPRMPFTTLTQEQFASFTEIQ